MTRPQAMTTGHTRLLRSPSQWLALACALGLGLALLMFVDLTPQIEADFFFSSDDPQLQGSLRIERESDRRRRCSSRRAARRWPPESTCGAFIV